MVLSCELSKFFLGQLSEQHLFMVSWNSLMSCHVYMNFLLRLLWNSFLQFWIIVWDLLREKDPGMLKNKIKNVDKI